MTSHQTIYLISGANRGIGLGLATALAKDPNNVIFAGARDPSKADALAALAKTNPNVKVLKLVSADLENNKAAISEIEKAFGRLDTIVANAGVAGNAGPLVSAPLQSYRDHFEVNTLGPIALFQAAHPLLEKSTSPHFAVISSVLGSISSFQNYKASSYGASKAAANYIIAAIHAEHPDVIASAHHPGWAATDMGNQGAQIMGMPAAPVSVQDSAEGVLSHIVGATREKTSGKFWNFHAASENPWDFAEEVIPCHSPPPLPAPTSDRESSPTSPTDADAPSVRPPQAPPVASRHIPLPNEVVDYIIWSYLPPTTLVVRLSIDELHIEWRPATYRKLLAIFQARPETFLMVNTLVVDLTDLERRDENWRRSPEGAKVRGEASDLYSWTENEYPYGEETPPEDWEEYVEGRSIAASISAGDSAWWPSATDGQPGGEKLAATYLWSLISCLTNLRQLSMQNVSQDMDEATLLRVRPVLAGLTTVGIEAGSSEGSDPFPIVKYLDSVHTLLLASDATLRPSSTAVARPRSGGALRHLRTSDDFEFDCIPFDLTNLVGLELRPASHQNVLDLVHLLPSLRDLECLYLDLLHPDKDRALVINALRSSSLTHLAINWWPTKSELALLPTSLEALTLAPPAEDVQFDITDFKDVHQWREKYFPELWYLHIGYSNDHLGNDILRDLRRRAHEAGFTVSAAFLDNHDNGVWHHPETWKDAEYFQEE
ncbi:hypothetical protein RQP46_005546 [Phenoliferia psychrophenolica]